MKFYNQGKEVPENAKKPIEAGHLKGYTDINPMWRIKKLTEMFGPCGIGWKIKTTKEEYKENLETKETAVFVNIELYIKIDREWSDPIEGYGGSMFTAWQNKNIWENKRKVGSEKILTTNDEALKMAKTDALSVCCKMLGIAADVYFDKDRTKHDLNKEAPSQNNSWQKGVIENSKTTKDTSSVFSPITEKQRKMIFAIIGRKAITKELLDNVVQEKYKKSISKLTTTEATQIITFVKSLLEESEIQKLKEIGSKKGFTSEQVLKAGKKKIFEYLTDVEYQQLVNRLGKLPDKQGKIVEEFKKIDEKEDI